MLYTATELAVYTDSTVLGAVRSIPGGWCPILSMYTVNLCPPLAATEFAVFNYNHLPADIVLLI